MQMTMTSLGMTVMGVMLIGMIHNPNTMMIGLVLLAISQTLMFVSGYRRAKGLDGKKKAGARAYA